MLVGVVPVLVQLYMIRPVVPSIPLQYSVCVPLGLDTAVVRAYYAPHAGDGSLRDAIPRRPRPAGHRICVKTRVRRLLRLNPRLKGSAPFGAAVGANLDHVQIGHAAKLPHLVNEFDATVPRRL